MEIIGTDGVISIDSFAQTNEVYSMDATRAQWSYWGESMDEYLVQAFVAALVEGKTVPISGEDGLNSAQVALAAYDSIREGTTVRLASNT